MLTRALQTDIYIEFLNTTTIKYINQMNKVVSTVLASYLTQDTVLFCMQPLLEQAFFLSLFLMRAVVG